MWQICACKAHDGENVVIVIEAVIGAVASAAAVVGWWCWMFVESMNEYGVKEKKEKSQMICE